MQIYSQTGYSIVEEGKVVWGRLPEDLDNLKDKKRTELFRKSCTRSHGKASLLVTTNTSTRHGLLPGGLCRSMREEMPNSVISHVESLSAPDSQRERCHLGWLISLLLPKCLLMTLSLIHFAPIRKIRLFHFTISESH